MGVTKGLDGREIDPGEGVIPILHKSAPREFRVVGTGFYITNYGLVLTAAHVVDELYSRVDSIGRVDGRYAVLHMFDESQPDPRHPGARRLHPRRIRFFSLSKRYDIAVLHAENYASKFPQSPLMNRRPWLSAAAPPIGAKLVTYGYPENAPWDLRDREAELKLSAHYYEGNMLEVVDKGPGIPYPHYTTTIEMPHGTSGGPVFYDGRIIGVNCRAWNFRGAEHEGNPLSSVVPIGHAFPLKVGIATMPPGGLDFNRVPEDRRVPDLTIGELAACGVINVA